MSKGQLQTSEVCSETLTSGLPSMRSQQQVDKRQLPRDSMISENQNNQAISGHRGKHNRVSASPDKDGNLEETIVKSPEASIKGNQVQPEKDSLMNAMDIFD